MRAWLCVIAGLFLLVAPRAQMQSAPVVYTAEVDGIIQPVIAEYLGAAIQKADAAEAALLVVTLRTPGGLLDTTRDINNAIIRARTPIAVWVGPSGNRAASAGFLITMAADIAAMAPGTHIGAAHPVSGDGSKMDDTMARKVASDTASYGRTLAQQRKRNAVLIEQAVNDSRSFTEQEAVSAVPVLIDVIASDIPDLLAKIDGRTITRFDGRSHVLRVSGARLEAIDMTWAQRVLSAVAHPQIAYLLLTLGMLGLTVEFWNPGAIFPGVAGGISLLLAFFALQVLPVSYAGVLLIVLGLVLLILEVKVTSFGVLAVGGVSALFFGSLMLIDSPLPEMQIGLRLIVPITLSISVILLFLVQLAVKAQKQPSVTGAAGMIGGSGRALTSFDAAGSGRVQTHGEIWTATASEPISAGDRVQVVGVTGLLLTVRRL
ncbi:MAG: nodulation protein NfeD [Acidobacteria bacterium]|nr:nodulation protein NfeD [Acidobacteriota bacterium]